jgi:transketolase
MEGVAAEAASLAGHLGLGKLIYLYDQNEITLAGTIGVSFSEDIPARFRAVGWHVQEIDGMDTDQVRAALEAAQAETERPSLICARTVIGFGSPKADTFGGPRLSARRGGRDEDEGGARLSTRACLLRGRQRHRPLPGCG